jgi:hypothetical protein
LVKRLDFNTISQNTNIIDELKRFTNKKNIDNSLSRVVNDSVNGFSIDTEEVLFIEKEGYHSYTFLINRDEDNDSQITENLFISLQPDLTYKSYVIQYLKSNTNDLEEITLFNTIALNEDFDSSIFIEALSRGSGGCTVDKINALGDDGVEYDDVNDCYANNGSGGCDRIVIHYIGVNCPSVIAQASGDNGGGGSNSADGGSNGNNGNTGSDNSGGYEQTDGDSGDYGDNTGTGGDGSSTDNNDSDTDNPPDEDCILDANGNCIKDTTAILIKDKKTQDQKNCEELNKLFETPDYAILPPFLSPKAAIANLKSLVGFAINPNNNLEKGYNLLHNSNLETSASWVTNISNRSVRYKFTQNNYGGLHLHPNDGNGHPFFSPEDILNLWKFSNSYNSGTTVDPSLFVHVLVSTKGVYALKIDDPEVFNELGDIYNDYKDADGDGTNKVAEFVRPLKNAYNKFKDSSSGYPIGSDSQYETAFLKFMNNFNGDGNKIGISIYKANNDLTGWSKLTIDENTGSSTPTPCN